MRRIALPVRATAAMVGVRAMGLTAPPATLSGVQGYPCTAVHALSLQRSTYFTTTPVRPSWLRTIFFGNGASAAQTPAAAPNTEAVVTTAPPHGPESVMALLKHLAEDKETPLTFLVKLMKNISAKLREKQALEIQAVLEETSRILSSMRQQLQGLVDKVAAAEALLNKQFPTHGEQPKLEDVEAFVKNGGKTDASGAEANAKAAPKK